MLNAFYELIAFFSTEEHPVTDNEFKEFWLSLSFKEKLYYRSSELG
jgi:hypothetical protein